MELDHHFWDAMTRFLAAFALVAVIMLVSINRRLRLERELAMAIVRAFAQLMIMALVIDWIFGMDYLLLVLIMLSGMLVLAAHTSATRAKGVPDPQTITFTAIATGSFVTLTLMILAGVITPEPIQLIPLGGMTIGNSMNVTSLALNRMSGEVHNTRDRIEAALALGATGEEAMEGLARLSVRNSLIPTIDNLKTLGIVLIPGVMTGLILAGTPPMEAALFQIVIFFMILCSNIIASSIAVRMATGRFINDRHQLVNVPDSEQ